MMFATIISGKAAIVIYVVLATALLRHCIDQW